MWSRNQRVILHYVWVSLIISHHSAKFWGHRPSRRWDIFMWPHLIMGSEGCPHCKYLSYEVWWSQTLCKRRNFVFRLSHDVLQRVMWHYVWVSLVISDYPAEFGDHRPFGRGDIKLSIFHITSRDHVVRGSYDIMGEFSSS